MRTSPAGWVWPVPSMSGQGVPVISQEFSPSHLGVDIMFRGAGGFHADQGTPILAAHDGKVTSAGHTVRGWNVVVDHTPLPYSTFYQHLEMQPLVAAGEFVVAGQRLGLMGVDPLDAAHIRHLHFAVFESGRSVDPRESMAGWARISLTS